MLRYATFYNDETYPCSTVWSVCVFVGVHICNFGLYILWVGCGDHDSLIYQLCVICIYCVCKICVNTNVFLVSVYKCIGCLSACVWLNTRSGDHDSLMRRALLSNVISKFVSPIHSYLQQCPIHSCVSIHAFLHKYNGNIQLCSTWVLVCNVTCVYQSQCGQVHFLVFSGPQGDGGTIALVHQVLSSTQPCSLSQPPSNEEEYDEAWFRALLPIKMNSYW